MNKKRIIVVTLSLILLGMIYFNVKDIAYNEGYQKALEENECLYTYFSYEINDTKNTSRVYLTYEGIVFTFYRGGDYYHSISYNDNRDLNLSFDASINTDRNYTNFMIGDMECNSRNFNDNFQTVGEEECYTTFEGDVKNITKW